jgi:hypothetical protein
MRKIAYIAFILGHWSIFKKRQWTRNAALILSETNYHLCAARCFFLQLFLHRLFTRPKQQKEREQNYILDFHRGFPNHSLLAFASTRSIFSERHSLGANYPQGTSSRLCSTAAQTNKESRSPTAGSWQRAISFEPKAASVHTQILGRRCVRVSVKKPPLWRPARWKIVARTIAELTALMLRLQDKLSKHLQVSTFRSRIN